MNDQLFFAYLKAEVDARIVDLHRTLLKAYQLRADLEKLTKSADVVR